MAATLNNGIEMIESNDQMSELLDELLSRMQKLEGQFVAANQSLRQNHRETLIEMAGIRAKLGADPDNACRDEKLEYIRAVRRIHDIVEYDLPSGATVLVVSKGDDALVDLQGRKGWHFPRTETGAYTGFSPADSGSAIIQLEALRAKGAGFLVFPHTALWWLDYYTEFGDYLESRYQLLLRHDDTCAIYSLRNPWDQHKPNVWTSFENVLAEIERSIDREPAVLDWETNCGLGARFRGRTVFSPTLNKPPDSEPVLPYMDGTIDIVAVASSVQPMLSEAQRVAHIAVVEFDLANPIEPTFKVHWQSDCASKPLRSTSIIIPSYNGISLTDDCIRALQENLPRDFRGEIIVVDNNSTDDTVDRMEHLIEQDGRIRFLQNPQNIGFIGSCNRGAAEAIGEILVFLNNDTLPLAGWLQPLLKIFDDHPDAGAVGCKLVYPDGRLQEAGGLIFSDGSAANFGRGDFEVNAPLYNYVREVDYVTGALIATPRQLFKKLGGLDPRYQPAYYEETDYCFRVRKAGFKVYYQPESVVIHLEGMTNGIDELAGEKSYQLVNQLKFAERWRQALRRQPDNPHHFDAGTWYALAVREERERNTGDSCELHNGEMKASDQSPTKRKKKRAK